MRGNANAVRNCFSHLNEIISYLARLRLFNLKEQNKQLIRHLGCFLNLEALFTYAAICVVLKKLFSSLESLGIEVVWQIYLHCLHLATFNDTVLLVRFKFIFVTNTLISWHGSY